MCLPFNKLDGIFTMRLSRLALTLFVAFTFSSQAQAGPVSDFLTGTSNCEMLVSDNYSGKRVTSSFMLAWNEAFRSMARSGGGYVDARHSIHGLCASLLARSSVPDPMLAMGRVPQVIQFPQAVTQQRDYARMSDYRLVGSFN